MSTSFCSPVPKCSERDFEGYGYAAQDSALKYAITARSSSEYRRIILSAVQDMKYNHLGPSNRVKYQIAPMHAPAQTPPRIP